MLPVLVKPGAAATASRPPAGRSQCPALRPMAPATYLTSCSDADDAARYCAAREQAALGRSDVQAAYFWHRLAHFAQCEADALRALVRR